MEDPQWCLSQAESIGPECHSLIRRLFANRVLDNLRAAQGVIGLRKKYGDARLEAACRRALFFDNPRRGAVKSILQKGLDQVPFDHQAPLFAFPSTYTGSARFLRPAGEFQVN